MTTESKKAKDKTIEMTEEQKELFDIMTPLQQKVATNVLAGMSNIDSYIHGGGKAKTKAAQEAGASELLSNPKVKAFLDTMKHAAVTSAVMSREEMLERLSNLSRVNMSDLITWHTTTIEKPNRDGELEEVEQSIWSIKESAEQDPYAMASIAEVTAGKDGFKIKQHSPLAAMKQLAEMAGYNAATKVDHSGSVNNVNYTPESYKEAQEKLEGQFDDLD